MKRVIKCLECGEKFRRYRADPSHVYCSVHCQRQKYVTQKHLFKIPKMIINGDILMFPQKTGDVEFISAKEFYSVIGRERDGFV